MTLWLDNNVIEFALLSQLYKNQNLLLLQGDIIERTFWHFTKLAKGTALA